MARTKSKVAKEAQAVTSRTYRKSEPQVGYNGVSGDVESRTSILRNIDLLEQDIQTIRELFGKLAEAIVPVLRPEDSSDGENSVGAYGPNSELNQRIENLREQVQYIGGYIFDVHSRVDL